MNRQFVKNSAYFFSKPFSLKFFRNLSGQNFIFPFYHLVADKPPLHVKNLYPTVTSQHFVDDLEFLLKNYQPATKRDVLNFIRDGKKSLKPFFFLTFDDGMRECYDIIYPILKQKGLEAAFFINPAFVGNKELFYKHKISLIIENLKESNEQNPDPELLDLLKGSFMKEKEILEKVRQLGYSESGKINKTAEILGIDFETYLKEQIPYMTLEQILDLHNNGFVIGSHSYDHPKFWEITEEKMQGQLTKSFDYIDKNIQPGIRSFAFPFSDINMPTSFFKFLYQEVKLDFSFGTAGIKNDSQPNHLQRIPMEVRENRGASQIIRTEYAYYLLKSFFGKNTIHRQ